MEYTEPKTAEMLARNRTEWANIESNNGGRGFARNVERILRQMNITHTTVSCFCQTDNKQVRIFTKSADVNNMTFSRQIGTKGGRNSIRPLWDT